jgi:hypothetical protein
MEEALRLPPLLEGWELERLRSVLLPVADVEATS